MMCNYCKGESAMVIKMQEIDADISIEDDMIDIYVTDNCGNSYIIQLQCNYCPMCGRKLNNLN